jgi:uncharacterized protein (TIGR03067 family)
VLAENAGAASVPSPLIAGTVQSACLLATGQAVAASAVPTQVAALMDGVLKTMLLTRLKIATTLVLVAVACSGIGVLSHSALGQTKTAEVTPGRPSLATPRKDIESLQGVWRVVSSKAGNSIAMSKDAYFMVRGNRACWEISDQEQMEGGLYLDSTSNPRAFDFATSRRTMEGIYSLEGDTLRLCYDLTNEASRPQKFSVGPRSQRVLIVLKREKGMDISNYRLADGSRVFPKLIEGPVKPTPPPHVMKEPPPARVGQIFIVGNEKTPQTVILKQIPLYPGQVLDYPSLRKAEAQLAQLKLFVVDPQKGIRPTVEVIDRDGDPYKDILVTVQEANTGNLAYGVGVNSTPGLTGSIVLNERNFEIRQPPTNLEIQAKQAEKDLAIAEFYRQAGHTGSAVFYYDLICRRYPGTPTAKLAKQRLEELRKSVGE